MDVAITHLAWRPYALPLVRPWCSAYGCRNLRKGWLLELTTDDGYKGLGDCAPLPEAGTEDMARVVRLRYLVEELVIGRTVHWALEHLPPWPRNPALRCALETALLNLIARREGNPMAQWLNPHAATSVRVNGVAGALDQGVGARVDAAIAGGMRVIKLKLGVYPLRDELRRLEALATGLPAEASLRLDANCAWTPAQAVQVLDALEGLPIESLEEPLEWPDPEQLRRLQGRVPWPLALDESLALLNLQTLLAHPPVRRLVCKPMVMGGLRRIVVLAKDAAARGVECVVTTTVDSAVGSWAAVHLAAALNNGQVHGLATSDWLREDLYPPPRPVRGRIFLDAANGSSRLSPPIAGRAPRTD